MLLASAWNWWLYTDAGLGARLGLGAAFFLGLAVMDLRRHGREAQRWREYLFLLAAAAVAMAYGLINDLITSAISWEYFYYGKGLDEVLGPVTPPDAWALARRAAVVGVKSTWSAGLIVGAALLVANNPRRGRPRLAYGVLYRMLPLLVLIPAVTGALVGLYGYRGGLACCSKDLADLVREDLFRPRRFLCVFGVHLGGYIGGAIAAVVAVVRVVGLRRRIIPPAASSARSPAPCTPGACPPR